jgi:cytochrome c peroxidase
MPIPEDNPLTPEKVALGRKLFHERRLSRDMSMSCATCHDPKRAFTDTKPMAVGVFRRRGTRSAPTLVNRGYGVAFFWDGRATSLEEQVLQPIQNPNELDMPLEEVVARLKDRPEYRRDFRMAFGSDPNGADLARALASYVRSILSGDSPFDRYIYGDRDALSAEANLGLKIFRGKANCVSCHVGPNLTDEHFHNTGVAWHGGKLLDTGRFAVSGEEKDHGAFKTPSLREIARTPPYMHDGSLASLGEVIEFYNRGGRVNPWLDSEIHSLHLTTEEEKALIAFLQSLSGTVREGTPAPR